MFQLQPRSAFPFSPERPCPGMVRGKGAFCVPWWPPPAPIPSRSSRRGAWGHPGTPGDTRAAEGLFGQDRHCPRLFLKSQSSSLPFRQEKLCRIHCPPPQIPPGPNPKLRAQRGFGTAPPELRMEGIKRGRIAEKRRRHKRNRTKSCPRSAKKAPRERGLDFIPARVSTRMEFCRVPGAC